MYSPKHNIKFDTTPAANSRTAAARGISLPTRSFAIAQAILHGFREVAMGNTVSTQVVRTADGLYWESLVTDGMWKDVCHRADMGDLSLSTGAELHQRMIDFVTIHNE